MARKSKRNVVNIKDYQKQDRFSVVKLPLIIQEEEKIPTAIYARLSVLKEGENEESIENQINLIRRFILDHPEMELVDTYTDKDRTGTNFERPEFMRLISDLTRGKVSCVVVKDLSRFGRDYIETGVFIENIFPKLGARLIAITDNFDSSRIDDVNSLAVPVKNMINEMYAKDISRKILSANKIRNRKSDSKLRGNAPYGYKYEDGRLAIDERYARYVRLIFQWKLMGLSGTDIARRLTVLGAPVPGNVTGNKDTDKFGGKWLPSKVYNILNNPEYTGDSYRGRFEVNKFGGYSRQSSMEKWLVYSNTHEPLVTREDYWKIAEDRKEFKAIMNDKMDKNSDSREKLTSDFPGLIYCAECNKAMVIKRGKFDSENKDYTHSYYICAPKEGKEHHCYNKVSVNFLRMVINEQIKLHLQVLCDRAELLKAARNSDDPEKGLYIDKKISELNIRLDDAKEKNIKLYEDYVSGVLDIEDYRVLKEKISEDDIAISEELKGLYKEKNHQLRDIDNFISSVEDLTKDSDEEFSNDIVTALIDRVYISKNNRFEIVFKHQDIYDEMFDYIGSDAT